VARHYYLPRQQGVVLVIALLLLLVITLVGISTLSTTALEERMVGNMQAKNKVFQAADAAIEEGVDDTEFLWDAYIRGQDPAAPEQKAVANADAVISSSQVEAEFVENTVPTGANATSLRSGASAYQLYHYYITGSAEMSNSNARSVHVQGAYLKGASAE